METGEVEGGWKIWVLGSPPIGRGLGGNYYHARHFNTRLVVVVNSNQ